jgi:hypothetical protein
MIEASTHLQISSDASNEDSNNYNQSNPLLTGNFLFEYDKWRITEKTEISDPIPIVKINGEIISTQENITTISGESKSGKSAFASIVLAGAVSVNGVYDGIEGIEVLPNLDRKAVLYFDTEQARHRTKRNVQSILKRCNLSECPENFLVYNVRNVDDLRNILSDICERATSIFGGIHLIVIDHIADFIRDTNDLEQSNDIVKYFGQLSSDFTTTIMTIVHTNPNSNKERGHIGSELQRKSESVIQVVFDKTSGQSHIKGRYLREAGLRDVSLLQFTYDKGKGYHVGSGVAVEDEQISKDEIRVNLVRSICDEVFKPLMSFGYNDAIDEIMKASFKKISTAKEYFKDMKAHGMICQGADKNWRRSS